MKIYAYCVFSIILLIICAFISCKKDSPTVVKGTIVDHKTGDPIEGVSIELHITQEGNPLNNSGAKYIKTDENGKFYFESNVPVYLFDLRKVGYLIKGGSTNLIPVKQHEINNLTIEMVPKDAFLKLVVNNTTNQSDSIYIGIYSPFQNLETPISNGVMFRKGYFLPGLGLDNELISLASEESVDIYWGFSPLPYHLENSPFHDTIFITRHDTTAYSIIF